MAIFVESSNDQSSGKGGITQIVQGPLQVLLLSPAPSYSKAKKTHMESLFASYVNIIIFIPRRYRIT